MDFDSVVIPLIQLSRSAVANYQIFYVGTEAEVAHHAASLQSVCDVRIADADDVARLAQPNDLAIFYSEHFERFRRAWVDLKQKGCNTLYAIDGILEWRNAWENREDEPACPWTMRPVLSDKVACIGASQARTLDYWGNAGKTEVTGITRFETLVPQTPRPRVRDGRFRLLVTTAKWPGFTQKQVQQITQSLLDLKAFLESYPEINGVPVDVHWRLTGDLHQTIGIENKITDLTGKELSQILENVDAVITTPSTVMLEAMLQERPVAILDYTNSPRYVDAAWSITAGDQIGATLEQLTMPSAPRMFLQRSILQDTLQCTTSATERLANLANEMIRIGHDCRAAGKPVEFPAKILPPLFSDAQWNVHEEKMFPTRPDIPVIKDPEESLAASAEAFRKIIRLQARIDLLHKELDNAAEAFDEIASHPVFSRLTRVRKIAASMGMRIADILAVRKNDAGDAGETEEADAGTIEVKT